MEQPYDYASLMTVIIKGIKEQTGVMCIEANSIGKMPPYPFFTWDFITSHQDIGFTDNVDEEVFEASIMFEAHTQQTTQALNLASQVRKLFETNYFDTLSADNNFYVIDTGDITDTNNAISIQVERRAGVQVNLRIKDSFHDDVPEIKMINPATDSDTNKEG